MNLLPRRRRPTVSRRQLAVPGFTLAKCPRCGLQASGVYVRTGDLLVCRDCSKK